MLKFIYCIRTRGDLLASYVFKDEKSKDKWLTDTFHALKSEYKNLTYIIEDLDGLEVGDECKVFGEGTDIFKILGVKKYSENRYGFLLDSGCWEEVSKCYKP